MVYGPKRPFLLRCESRNTRCIVISRVDRLSTDPRVLGCHNHFIILSLYVDDISIAGNDKKLINVTKKWLSSNFEMKDIGEASHVLGVNILRDRSKHILGLS